MKKLKKNEKVFLSRKFINLIEKKKDEMGRIGTKYGILPSSLSMYKNQIISMNPMNKRGRETMNKFIKLGMEEFQLHKKAIFTRASGQSGCS